MEMRQPNLILAGFMGTGKSTVGPILAGMMGRTFMDTDRLIEQEAGLSVSEIFAVRGEAAFRALERDACRRVAESTGAVVAVGGGALLDAYNREMLEASGVVVLLCCRLDVLVQRLKGSAGRGERPLLNDDIGKTISRLLREREPIYSSVRLRIDTTSRTPEQVASVVFALYSEAVPAELKAGTTWP